MASDFSQKRAFHSRNSLRLRVCLVVFAMCLATALSVFLLGCVQTRSLARRQTRAEAETAYQGIIVLVGGEIKPGQETALPPGVLAELAQAQVLTGLQRLEICVLDANGSIAYLFGSPDGAANDVKISFMPALKGDTVEIHGGVAYSSYRPVYAADGKVIAAIGMEVDTSAQQADLARTRIFGAVLSLAFVVLFTLASYFLFNLLSRSYFRRLTYADALTGVGNRNAFEADMRRLSARLGSLLQVSFMALDLTELRKINDTQGLNAGDKHLQTTAKTLSAAFVKMGNVYRVSGAAFAVIFVDQPAKDIQKAMDGFTAAMARLPGQNTDPNAKVLQASAGLATYSAATDASLHAAFDRAAHQVLTQKMQNMQDE